MADYGNQDQKQYAQAPPYSQPPAGWAPPQQTGPYNPGQAHHMQGHPQQYGQPVIIQQQPAPQTVVVMGGCPTCRVGHLDDEFTCLGILCCIIFFPLGLICLFTMKEKRCTNCGATFG